LKRWNGRPGFAFVDMSDMDKGEDFYYEVHPKPHVTIEWTKRLAAASTLPSSGASVAGSVSGALPETHIR
jgi:hypothetical protein